MLRKLRKRHGLYLITALALAAAFVVTGSAVSSEPVQTLEAQGVPDDQPTSSRSAVSLRIKPGTIDSADDVDVLPEKTDNFKLHLDNDFRLNDKGYNNCDPADLVGDDPATAMETCGWPDRNAWIGYGTAHVITAGPTELHAQIIAFNGKDGACGAPGTDTIVLYSRVPAFSLTTVLCGEYKDSTDADPEFGKMIEVAVPPLAGGAASFKDFEVFVARRVSRRDLVKARCSDGNWDFKSDVSFGADHASEIDDVDQPCT